MCKLSYYKPLTQKIQKSLNKKETLLIALNVKIYSGVMNFFSVYRKQLNFLQTKCLIMIKLVIVHLPNTT